MSSGGGVSLPGVAKATLYGYPAFEMLSSITTGGAILSIWQNPGTYATGNGTASNSLLRDSYYMASDPLSGQRNNLYYDFSEINGVDGEFEFWIETYEGNWGSADYTIPIYFYKDGSWVIPPTGYVRGVYIPVDGTHITGRHHSDYTTCSLEIKSYASVDAGVAGVSTGLRYKTSGTENLVWALKWRRLS